LITTKPKGNRKRILVVVVIGVIVATTVGFFFLFPKPTATQAPDFSLAVYKGTSDNPPGWKNISSTDIILNGTSGVNGQNFVAAVTASSGFSGFITLSLSVPEGITYSLSPPSVRPGASGVGASTLIITALSNVATSVSPFKFNLTGTGGTPAITHHISFLLRIRNTVLFLAPSTNSVLNGNSFNVGVDIQNAYNITGFQFTLSFDPSIFAATSITVAPEFQPPFGYINPFSNGGIDNTTGTVRAAAIITGRCGITATCITVSGSQDYTFATINFRADFTKHVTGTSLGCTPAIINGNTTTSLTCTAGVTDLFIPQTSMRLSNDIITEAEAYNILTPPFHVRSASLGLSPSSTSVPTGTVSFQSTSPQVTFSPASCTLVAKPDGTAFCTVTPSANLTTLTPVSITATYAGDPTHFLSSGTFELIVLQHNA
jgi:hypothetical protein